MEINPKFWRRWHRWIGFPAALFLLFAASTGVLVAGTEFFGEDEALREATRDLVSPVLAGAPATAWSVPLQQALSTVSATAGNAPVDKIEVHFKGDNPTVTVFTGKVGGGEDHKYVLSARTGQLLATEDYSDKPFLYRLHSGEAFGDGGLVVAMFWGLTLVALSISGTLIFWRMRRKDVTGWRRYFF